jgi:cell division protein FtsQ
MSPAMMAAKHYSFPVVTGITAQDPLPIRAARMHFYQQFINDLDSGGTKVSQQLSEVDISDPEDIRAVIPAQGGDILVHFGDSQFLHRYNLYQQHLAEWRRQYPHLASVDMRFDNQVVLEMAKEPGRSNDSEQTARDSKPEAKRSVAATHFSVAAQRQPKPSVKLANSKKSAAESAKHAARRTPVRSQQ